MDVSCYLSEASFWTPDYALDSLARSEYAPVASWLMDAARPRLVVQLGLREAGVYFALCEAIRRMGTDATCFAVEPTAAGGSGSAFRDASFRRLREAHDRSYATFSRLLKLPALEAAESFADGSIDVLHPATAEDVEALLDGFEAWKPKLSDRAVLILPTTGLRGRKFQGQAAYQALKRKHPGFEFTHGEGLGVIALGDDIPERLRPLFEADARPVVRNAIRSIYARLGAVVVERADAGGGEGLDATILDIGELQAADHAERHIEDFSAVEEAMALREELELLRDEFELLNEKHQAISAEHEALGRENPWLRRDLDHYRHHHASAQTQLEDIRRSTALRLIEKGRTMRARFFPETRLHGRCLKLTLRFLRVAAAEGPRPAFTRATRRVARKVRKTLGLRIEAAAPAAPPAQVLQAAPVPVALASTRFEQLPWTRGARDERDAGARVRATFKILLVSHSACRTGAPLCLLRLCRELSKLPDVECWVVLKTRGEIAAEFARLAPTLDLASLVDAGIASWADAPTAIASAFREYARNGAAICNTMAVSEFHEAFDSAGVPVLSWIHELPTFIEILGGVEAIGRIKAASRRIFVPADVVRNALITRFDVDPERIRTVRYGLEARTRGVPREEMRAKVRRELKLPPDAHIVLGCGTVDLRKGADLFVQTAQRFLLDPANAEVADRTWFVWFGFTVSTDLYQWIRHDIEAAGVTDRIRFAGVRDDMTPYFLAADVFTLTSREDPCPFANLEAMESALPVVAFDGGGGAPEVIGGGGIKIPYLDIDAMAGAVGELLADPARREAMGREGREIIRGRFTWPRLMDEIIGMLEADYGYRPAQQLKVSAIVPNYRHAPYLEERLRSIFEQTVRPHEIIFLDDASPDDSVDVARRLAAESPVPMRIVVNEHNSGSTFRQWLKGMELAEGDLIWFAESDDSCHPQFLERLVPEFHNPDVSLAYCQSALIGPNGERWAPDFLDHTADIDRAHWRGPFTADARDEAELGLSQKNTIPNASAVLFRKPARIDFAEELTAMRFAGDWLFYAMILRNGKIAFAPESLNSYRRHEQTVSFQSVKADTHAEETLHAKYRVFETFDVSLNAMARGLGQTLLEYDMLTERFALKRPPLSSNVRAAGPLAKIRDLMRRKIGTPGELKILLIVDGSETGFAANATIHLANALAREHFVFLCCASPSDSHQGFRDGLSDRVVLLEGTLGTTPWSNSDHPTGLPAGRLRATVLQELIRIHEIDVIHSRHANADRLAAQLNAELALPWFVHLAPEGDGWLDEVRLVNGSRVQAPADLISGVFYDGEQALALADARPELASKRWLPLYPGVLQAVSVDRPERIARRDDEFLVFLIAAGRDARRIRDDAMAAVRRLNRMATADRKGRRVRLVVSESGEPGFARQDRTTVVSPVHRDPMGLMAQCDAALAPMQDVVGDVSGHIAAALACHLPIIAPDRGPIHDLLTMDRRTAGVAAPPNDRGGLDVDRMVAAMLRYLRHPDLYAAHRDRARVLFDARFHVDQSASVCTEAYLHARDFIVFPRETRPAATVPERSISVSRESA